MYIKHYETCKSTQELFLKDELYKSFPAIISSDFITDAKGRRERKWDVYQGALACSFTLTKNSVITLSALEVSVLISRFFEKEYDRHLLLKWPNDLYDKNFKKCGGILINSSKEHLIVGLGMNLNSNDEYGSVFEKRSPIDCKALAPKLYQYIISHRLTSDQVIKEWNEKCYHLNSLVNVEEDSVNTQGIFKGIGSNGQALIEIDNSIKEIYSATLRPLP